MKNIVLIGFSGVGKTTVGRLLSSQLHMEFCDTDDAICRCEKMPITAILQKKGAKYFEGAQRFAVSTLAQGENCIISTGGDTVTDSFNLNVLRQNGILVWLTAKPETVYQNTRRSAERRPGLAKATAEDIADMMEKRRPFYEQADITVSVDSGDLEAVTKEIMNQCKNIQKQKG